MKKFLLSVSVLVFTSPLFAQDYIVQEQIPTMAIGFQPQSFIYNAAEIDFDLRLSPRNWLTIAPRLQFGSPLNSSYYYDPTDAIKNGYGFGLTYRYFPVTSRTRKLSDGAGPFVSAGLDYLKTNYSYLGNRYTNVLDPSSGFTIESGVRYNESSSQLGLSVNIGYNWRIFDIMYLEAFLGVGVKSSDYMYDVEKGFNLGESYWDTGYSGYYVSNGFRIGVYLNRYKYVLK